MKIFETEKKIYGYECDMYGHMNHAGYLHLYEEARCEALELLGLMLTEINNEKVHLYIRKAKVDYLNPVMNGESVTITSEITELSRAKIDWRQVMLNSKNEICNIANITSVFAKNGKIYRIKENINQLEKNEVKNESSSSFGR